MTLEKLLIFGVAIAVMVAVVALADRQSDTRETEKNNWKTSVDALADKP